MMGVSGTRLVINASLFTVSARGLAVVLARGQRAASSMKTVEGDWTMGRRARVPFRLCCTTGG